MNIPRLGTLIPTLGISNIYILFAFLYMTGCSTYTAIPDVPCPDRPVLTAIPEDIQLQMGEDAVFIVTENQLALKSYAKKLETRAGCE